MCSILRRISLNIFLFAEEDSSRLRFSSELRWHWQQQTSLDCIVSPPSMFMYILFTFRWSFAHCSSRSNSEKKFCRIPSLYRTKWDDPVASFDITSLINISLFSYNQTKQTLLHQVSSNILTRISFNQNEKKKQMREEKNRGNFFFSLTKRNSIGKLWRGFSNWWK